VVVNSAAGFKGMPYLAHYVAAKHGLVGLVRTLARELAPHRIRVNSIHPTGMDTPMGVDETLPTWLAAHPEHAPVFANALPVDRTSPEEVSRAMVWLTSEEAALVTGVALPVDAGCALP
jgi:NAD(P)-dependent dehydrogenase (short-subunit alcohol dehydrogenase family)